MTTRYMSRTEAVEDQRVHQKRVEGVSWDRAVISSGTTQSNAVVGTDSPYSLA